MVHFVKRDKNDIFSKPVLGFLFKNSRFLLLLRVTVAILFFYALYFGFAHPTRENIFTTAVFWGVFWALFMVVTLPTFGRIFCSICPHGFLGKYITRFGLKKTMPKYLQNRYIGIGILVVGWWGVYYTFDGFFKSPLNTAAMFSGLTILAFIVYYFYKDMSYCKFICPIGTLTRAYDKLSFTKLETYSQSCKECRTFECASACQYNLKPFTFAKKNQTDDCTLCMDCASSCEAVAFKFTKPAQQLSSKLKILNAEVWTYILIFASIPVSMGFAHGLNRSKIADEFIWNKTAEFFDLGHYAGGFAFLYAIIFSVFFATFGIYLASKILKKDYDSTFTNLGVALVPLFIFASLGHTLETFFTKEYKMIIEGFAQGLGFLVHVENIAQRGDGWLVYFELFKWIGIVWAFMLLYKRMQLIEATKLRKVFGYFFASSVILFYIALNIYTGYVFSKYGAKERGEHGSSRDVSHSPVSESALQDSKRVKKNSTYEAKKPIIDEEQIYFSLTNTSLKMHSHGGRPEAKGTIPTKKVWLLADTKNSPHDENLTTYAFDTMHTLIDLKSQNNAYTFEIPKNGYYTLFAVSQNSKDGNNFYKVAKLEYLHGNHGSKDIYTEDIKKQLSQNKTKIDLIRIKSKDEDSFFYTNQMGNTLTFQAFLDNKPLQNATVNIELQSAWIKKLQTDENGTVAFTIVRDYFPSWNEFDKRYKQNMLLTLKYSDDTTNYILTYPATYYPNNNDYESYGYALMLMTLTLVVAGIVVYRYRKNRLKPFKEESYA